MQQLQFSPNDDDDDDDDDVACCLSVALLQPYLTTPRSLEACRHHGVNPEELVEIPFREFQRAYPDDPEIALRRFERVDTARKIMLESVYQK